MRSRRLRAPLWVGIALGMAAMQADATGYGADRWSRRIHDDCYYYGRCSADELQRLRERLQRMDRVTPQPPAGDTSAPAYRLSDVPPTPDSHIKPEYREASRLREEYRGNTTERDGAPGTRSESP